MKNKLMCSALLCSCFSLSANLHICKDLKCCNAFFKKTIEKKHHLSSMPNKNLEKKSKSLYEFQFIEGKIFPKFIANYTVQDSSNAFLTLTPTSLAIKFFGKIYRTFNKFHNEICFSLYSDTVFFNQAASNNFLLGVSFDTKF
ncbi:MAG: hypothetical protein NTZ68_00995 [Candidatus Dependentiae bacterium]|nr:hypothetical protein [Candidatus Dependentiae bacterium]